MNLTIEYNFSHVLIGVGEVLDVRVAPDLKSELTSISDDVDENIILDLNKCKDCNVSGLSIILLMNRLCKKAGGMFVLTGLNSTIERMIKNSQIDSLLTITKTVEEAISLIEKS